MILDSSALVSIALHEPDSARVWAALEAADSVAIGAPTAVETTMVLSARLGRDARGVVSQMLSLTDAQIIPFTAQHFDVAMQAWLRFGKGRHPAALNFGDCMSYATARVAGLPLLCVGDDFPRTDLALVPV